MTTFNLRRGVAIAALALTTMLCASPSYAATDNLGTVSAKVDASDAETGKSIVALSTPANNTAVTTRETIHYIHKPFWFWQHNQEYAINYTGSADYVERLGYWMTKDVDGDYYRFNGGSVNGIASSRQSVDIGARGSVLDGNDRGSVSGVSAGALGADNSRSFNVTTSYRHVETYTDVTYSIRSNAPATFVELQNGFFGYVGGTLYRIDAAGNTQALRDKPTANIGNRASKITENDSVDSNSLTVTAGSTSFDTRDLRVTRDYLHEETFQRLRYSLSHTETATFVKEQNAYLAWIGNDLYRVRRGSDDVAHLNSKPVVDVGYHYYKLDSSDALVSVSIIPVSLTESDRAVLVNVRRVYRHGETFQVKEYYGQSTDIARYSDTYRVWTVLVDGRIYAVAFDGDVVNDSSVVVVHAPSGLHRPDVLVVKPTNSDDPPVVVPTKKRPPVVSPSTNDDPPVVIPAKKKPAPKVVDTDDDGPAVVVPGRH